MSTEPARRTLVVVNEHAGGGAMADIFRRTEHHLIDLLGAIEVAFTDGEGHAIGIVRDGLRQGFGRVIVGGGDGTLNECVNGFFDEDGAPIAPDAELALLSGGTGGDFRKTLGIRSTEDAMAALAGGRVIPVDVGKVSFTGKQGPTHRHFLNIASFGLSGLVDQNIGAWRRMGGAVAYFGATLKSMWGWKNPKVQLTLDGETMAPRPIITVAVGNGRYFGGGMKICPDARLDSGVFEITVLGDLSRLELIMLSRSIYDGAHVYNPKVTVRRAKVVVATPEPGRDVHLDIDGEPLGTLPARFELLPRALRLVVSPLASASGRLSP